MSRHSTALIRPAVERPLEEIGGPKPCSALAWAAAILLASWPPAIGGTLAVIEIQSGAGERVNVPMSMPLDNLPLEDGVSIRLEENRGGHVVSIPSQLEPGQPPVLTWILDGKTPPATIRQFRLVSSRERSDPVARFEKDGSAATLWVGDRPVLRYHHAVVAPPGGAGERYRRSGFIHPLWSPSGEEMTRIHPADHIHHFGLWAPWTRTRFQDQSIDFWNLNQGEGTVRFARFLSETSGTVQAGFRVLQEHLWLKSPKGEQVVLNETLEVRVWSHGSAPEDGWLVDYTFSLECATGHPVTLEAYRYGGLGMRGTERWHQDNSDYLTSENRTRLDGDGTRARWCDVFGNTGRTVEGVLFMSHPDNREHPEPMRIWPADANGGRGDVFFNFCPIRIHPWVLEPGRKHTLRYRLWIHAGRATAADAERLWRDFVSPPKTRLIATHDTN